MPKPIKKSNHRVFGIIISSLIIIALLAMIPLSLVSMNKNNSTDQRSQASGQNFQEVELDQDETSFRGQFVTQSRRGVTDLIYFDGEFTTNTTRLLAGEYEFDIQYNAYDIVGRGFYITITCMSDSCPQANNQPGTVGPNGAVYTIKPTALSTGQHRIRSRFRLGDGNYVVRVFANDGTKVWYDFIRLDNYSTQTQILKNPSFQEGSDMFITRKNAPVNNLTIHRQGAVNNVVLPTYLYKQHVFMHKGRGGTLPIMSLILNHYKDIVNGRRYQIEMAYFLPQYNRMQAKDIQMSHGGISVLYENLDFASSDCKIDTGSGCTFNVKQFSFTGTNNNQQPLNFNIHGNAEMYIDYIKIIDTTDNSTVYFTDFSSVQDREIELKYPSFWKASPSWKQAYGTVALPS